MKSDRGGYQNIGLIPVNYKECSFYGGEQKFVRGNNQLVGSIITIEKNQKNIGFTMY